MAHTWWHVWGEIDKRHQKQWNTRDPNQNFYGVNDPRRAVRETTNRWSKKGSEAIDNLPEWVDPVKEVVGGVTKVVAGGLFGEGGLLRSDMNALGLQPVDALRAIDAGFETVAKVSGVNRNVLDTADALLPFTPTAANLVKKGAKTVVRKSGAGALIDTATGQGMFAHAGTGLHKGGKGKFRRTKTTDKLHRLIDESKEAELAKQLGYENADAIEAGLKITPVDSIGEGTITKPFVIPKGNTLAARDSRKSLRENYSSWIREEMKKPEIRRPEDIDRRGRIIQTSDGESLSMQGVKKVWNAIKRGETDAEIAAKTGKNAYITFGATNPESKGIRVKKMQPPVEEARAELIETRPDLSSEQIDEIVKAWNKASKHGYASTAETARWEGLRYDQRKQELKLKSEGVKKYKTPVSEKTRPQLAAGHGRSVMSKVDHYTKPEGYTGRLYDAPTDQQAVRLEDAIENIKHGNKPEGDINFYAAKKAGWPTTWRESIHNFVDKYLGENKLPDWRQGLNNAQVEKILKIPSKWGPDKVDVYWEKYIEPLTKHGDIKQSWEIWEDISRRSRRGFPK